MAIVPAPSTDTPDLPPLPPLILLLLGRWWTPILAWLTTHLAQYRHWG